MDKLRDFYNKICSVSDKIRFVIVGCINAAISYFIFAIALFVLGNEHYQLCVILQWTISSIFSYLNQMKNTELKINSVS